MGAFQVGPLIGDIIIESRELIPSMPGTIQNPTATYAVVVSAGSTLPAGTYYCVATQLNQWGETIGAAESSALVVPAGSGIMITMNPVPGATSFNAYLTLPGGAAGSECQYFNSTSTPFVVATNPTGVGSPPDRNTAWNPDSNSDFVSAAAIYRWINNALAKISRHTGGLRDYGGVQSVLGQPFYAIPGQWNAITDVWYDGYWMQGADKGYFFRRNQVTSQVLSSATVSVQNNVQYMEVYPQPARTSSVTTLSAPMGVTDTQANLTNASGFVLPFGFMQVDNELMQYSNITGNLVSGLIPRGIGGSLPVAHLAGATVLELNLFFAGRRQMLTQYAPGNAALTLPVPSGWELLLINYVSGRAKLVEHDTQGFQAFDTDMDKMIKNWAETNKGVMKRRQIGPTNSPVTYHGDCAGGLILP
jgi:hypothetical protein